MASKKARDDVITFFENLGERRFRDASRALKVLKKKSFGDPEFREGYLKGLDGLLLSARTGDERDFLNRAPFDPQSMKRYKKEFSEFVKNGIRSPFDVGFFLAWLDMVQYRLKPGKND